MRKQVSMSENASVGTLARGLDVLELFGAARPELSQKEISEALALPMPTVHRLTALLTAHCTALGKCLLAQLPVEAARAALGPEPYRPLTEHTRTNWVALAADL